MEKYILIFGKEISWYSIMGFAGLLAAFFLCVKRRNRFGLQREDLVNIMGYAVVGGIVGAKALALLCMIPQFVQYWEQIEWSEAFLRLIFGNGFVYYGGLFGVLGAFLIYCRQYRISLMNLLELTAPAIPLFHTFGRIGCYIAGCCGGINGFPLQLAEAAANFLLFLFLIWAQERPALKGRTFQLYLFSYAVIRFFLEFFRGDPERGFLWIFSVSQWISLGILISVSVIWRRQKYRSS